MPLGPLCGPALLLSCVLFPAKACQHESVAAEHAWNIHAWHCKEVMYPYLTVLVSFLRWVAVQTQAFKASGVCWEVLTCALAGVVRNGGTFVALTGMLCAGGSTRAS